jgi:hydroxyacylglutathione hydrolase
MPAWLAAGHPQNTTAFTTADRTPAGPYLDVRQQSEYAAGHVPGALHLELGELVGELADDRSGGGAVPQGAVVACGHGERAMTAASLLERAGHTGVTVLNGGPADYAAAHGTRLATADGAGR